jgi:hypothetical protein
VVQEDWAEGLEDYQEGYQEKGWVDQEHHRGRRTKRTKITLKHLLVEPKMVRVERVDLKAHLEHLPGGLVLGHLVLGHLVLGHLVLKRFRAAAVQITLGILIQLWVVLVAPILIVTLLKLFVRHLKYVKKINFTMPRIMAVVGKVVIVVLWSNVVPHLSAALRVFVRPVQTLEVLVLKFVELDWCVVLVVLVGHQVNWVERAIHQINVLNRCLVHRLEVVLQQVAWVLHAAQQCTVLLD